MTFAVLAFLAAVNPPAAALAFERDRRPDRPVPILAGAGVAFVVLGVLAVFADSLIDVLDLSLGTFRLGAGVVLALTGLRWLVAGPAEGVAEPDSPSSLATFVAFPVLLTPGAAVLAVAVAAGDDGVGGAVVAAAVGLAGGVVALLLRRRIPPVVGVALVRIVGAAAIVLGIALGVDGVETL